MDFVATLRGEAVPTLTHGAVDRKRRRAAREEDLLRSSGTQDVVAGAPSDFRLNAVLAYFFFQAEDGIRDYKVTGVQTCALPICKACSSNSTTTIFNSPFFG